MQTAQPETGVLHLPDVGPRGEQAVAGFLVEYRFGLFAADDDVAGVMIAPYGSIGPGNRVRRPPCLVSSGRSRRDAMCRPT